MCDRVIVAVGAVAIVALTVWIEWQLVRAAWPGTHLVKAFEEGAKNAGFHPQQKRETGT